MYDDRYDDDDFDLLELSEIKCTKCFKKSDSGKWEVVETYGELHGGYWSIICPICKASVKRFLDVDEFIRYRKQEVMPI